MSESENNRDRRNAPIPSQIYSELVPRRSRISQVNTVRIFEEAVRDIRDNVRRMLEPRYSSDSASGSELYPNIVIERVFSFIDLDHSLLTDKSLLTRIEQREPSLISYESNLFENTRANSGDMTTHQPSTLRENGEIEQST